MTSRLVAKTVGRAMAAVLMLAVATGLYAQQGSVAPSAAPAASQVVAAPDGDAATASVARLRKAEGDVLASTETGLIAVSVGAEFVHGTRVMTMARASATIRYKNGCEVVLEPNMRVEIRREDDCKVLQDLATLVVPDPATELALATALETPTASIPALVLGGALGGPAGALAGLAGAAAIIGNRPEGSVSPN